MDGVPTFHRAQTHTDTHTPIKQTPRTQTYMCETKVLPTKKVLPGGMMYLTAALHTSQRLLEQQL